MRDLTEREVDLLQSDAYRVHFKVYFEDMDGNMVEFTDFEGRNWIRSLEISDDIDSPSKTYNFELKRNLFKRSLVTLMKDSPYNLNDSDEYAPKILVGRDFEIELAITELNEEPYSDHWRIFEKGVITQTNFDSDPIDINAVCISEKLKKYIRAERVYGSETGEPVENEMQKIIDDHESNVNITLQTPESPGWNIYRYKQRKEYLYDALRELAHQIGWEVKTRYSITTEDMEIMFYEPERNPDEVSWIFGPGDYSGVTRLKMDKSSIRNVIRITYSDLDEETEDGEPGKRMQITKEDQTSIDLYGEIFMEISEAGSSNINTAPEANTMAENALHDLKDAKADHSIETLFFFPAQLHDTYRFRPNGVHYDREQEFGVVGYRHQINFEEGKKRTLLDTRGKPNMSETGNPIGLFKEWFKKESRPGIARGNPFFPPSQPQNVIARTAIRGITISYDLNPEEDVTGYNIYCSNTDGFAASKENRVAEGMSTQFTLNSYYDSTDGEIKDMESGETYYILVKAYDDRNNLSEVSIQVSAEASQADEGDLSDGSITENKLANNAVTEDKIADSSITVNKINNGAITKNKISDNAVDYEKTNGYTHPENGTHEIEIDGEVKEVEIKNGLIVDIIDST